MVRKYCTSFLLFCAVFIPLSAKATSLPQPSQELEDVEYDIIAAVISKVHLTSTANFFYLSQLTASFNSYPESPTGLYGGHPDQMRDEYNYESPREVFRLIAKRIPKTTPALFSDFFSKTQLHWPVERKLPISQNYEFWTPAQYKSRDVLGRASLAIVPSRVGFSKNKKIALVFIGSVRRPYRIEFDYFVLEQVDSKWEIIGSFNKLAIEVHY